MKPRTAATIPENDDDAPAVEEPRLWNHVTADWMPVPTFGSHSAKNWIAPPSPSLSIGISGSMAWPSPTFRVSVNVDQRPDSDWDCFSMSPLNRSRPLPEPSASKSCSISFLPSLPFAARSAIASLLLPVAAASKSKTGTPASRNWLRSSPVILPAADICWSAIVARLTPSEPVPMPEVTSPRVRMIGMTLSALRPADTSDFAAVCNSGNSNGVLAAKSASCLRNDSAFWPDPSMVVNEIRACSIPAAVSMPALAPMTPTAASATAPVLASDPTAAPKPDDKDDPSRCPPSRPEASRSGPICPSSARPNPRADGTIWTYACATVVTVASRHTPSSRRRRRISGVIDSDSGGALRTARSSSSRASGLGGSSPAMRYAERSALAVARTCSAIIAHAALHIPATPMDTSSASTSRLRATPPLAGRVCRGALTRRSMPHRNASSSAWTTAHP